MRDPGLVAAPSVDPATVRVTFEYLGLGNGLAPSGHHRRTHRLGQAALARVPASPRNHALVAQLGAEHVIDYLAVRFEDHVGNMDVVFDTVGGDTLQRSWGTLRPRGRMITIATEGESAAEARVKDAFFIVEPNHDQLTRIGDLLQAGDLRPVVGVVVPLSQASVAHAGEAPGRLGRGKVIVAIAAWVPDPLVGRQERT